MKQFLIGAGLSLFASVLGLPLAAEQQPAQRLLLWGDTHLHTSYSFDAFLNGNQSADPETAYRYARGYPVLHPYTRARVRINTPLDFLVISDHAEFYGGIRDIYLSGIQAPDLSLLERIIYWWHERQIRNVIDLGEGPAYFADLLPDLEDPQEAAARWVADNASLAPPGAETSATNAWHRMIKTAERYYEPGVFSTLIGWEWSSVPGGANLHRVVVTDASSAQAGEFMPFASTDSPFPEDLWDWLEVTSTRIGARFVAIPHNSNISRGTMFSAQTLRGKAMDAKGARLRRHFEPIVEITQIKGDSETHPLLSPDDPFADFELYPWYILRERTNNYQATLADYVRPALRTGLEIEARIGENPFRFGVIGSTDSHTGLASAEEPNFWGKMAYDSIPGNKQGRTIADGPTGWTMQAGGLAAVWAEENTREAILDAFQRREVYATTGPRIRMRMFAGYDFDAATLAAADFADAGYASGVPMGGELTPAPDGRAPVFMVRVERDPVSAPLDRIQMVKGWLDDEGRSHERIYDLAWSGDREPDAEGRVPAVDSSVDLSRGTWHEGVGAPALEALWVDPAFEVDRPAFWYVRALEIPTPRHAQLDAIALGLERPTEGPQTIQERAYSSPIWYDPDDQE